MMTFNGARAITGATTSPGSFWPVSTSGGGSYSSGPAMPVVREATFADHEAISALEAANGLKSRTRDHWAAMWTSNPVYREIGLVWPLGWVLEDERTGRLVGTLSNIPLPYMFRGQPVLAATGRGWAVEPEYRGYAPLLLDEYINQSADLLLSTTVNGLAEASHAICEQSRVPVGDWSHAAFAVTSYAGFAEAALRIRKTPAPALLSGVAGPALWLRDRTVLAMRGGGIRSRTNGITVTCGTGFDSGFDLFWAELQARKQDKLLGVRTREVLEWHFGAAIQQDRLRVLSVEKQDRLIAYAILQRADHSSSGLKRMRVVDYQCLSDDKRVPAAILRRASALCLESGVHALEIVGCGLPAFDVLEHAMPHRRELPAWCYYYHSNDPALMRELASPSAWEPSSFDGDSSI